VAVLVLRTRAFRNLVDGEINTGAKDVFLVGGNGQGKTNFLEALYFCSYASSFRGVKDRELVCNGGEDFSASAESVQRGETFSLPERISVTVEKSRKTITLDGKKIEDRKDLLKAIPCVAFCHEDMEFVSGTQERRRWFFDQTQSLYDLAYLEDLRRYRRVLKIRNTVLKDAKLGDSHRTAEMLDALDPQLAEYGLRLMEKRRLAAERFSAVFGPLYREVSGVDGIGVSYVPSWKTAGTDILRCLAERRAADLAQGITLSGPHRDRYVFVRNGSSAGPRKGEGPDFADTASTGQRRLLALLLRVAQARCFSENSGKTPVLLLDDVLLELDGEKRRRFLSVMPDYEQAFFTFLPEEPYKRYCGSDTLVYYVSNGVISDKAD
jgi:DNA replication and repair protein RecF